MKKNIAVPPGKTICEQLEYRDITQKELALRMGMSEKNISSLIGGYVKLDHNIALKLESGLGVPAEFWDRFEYLYREQLKYQGEPEE